MMRHPHVWMGLLLWSVFGQAHAAWTTNMAPGATEVSHAVFDLHMTIFWICVVIGIVVFGVLVSGCMLLFQWWYWHNLKRHPAEMLRLLRQARDEGPLGH